MHAPRRASQWEDLVNDSGNKAQEPKTPGDEVPPGTTQSGANTCRACGGSGSVESKVCSECGGSGQVTVLVGDA